MQKYADDNRIQMTIIGGFLGAGKSTWLRHQLFKGAYQDSFVVVNEMGPSAIDDVFFQPISQLYTLSGKCVCCEGQEQMVCLLQSICELRTKAQLHVSDELIFEMTGVADPARVLSVIQSDPVLSRHIVLKETIVISDGLDGLEQLNTEQLAREQVEAADRILISKVDLACPVELARIKSALSFLNPAAPIKGVKNGVEVEFENLPHVDARQLIMLNELDSTPLTSTQIVLESNLSGNTDWAGFSVWLSAMLHRYGKSLVRVKGVVQTPAGRLLIQSVRQRIQPPVILPSTVEGAQYLNLKDNKVILIGRGLCQSDIDRSVGQFVI